MQDYLTQLLPNMLVSIYVTRLLAGINFTIYTDTNWNVTELVSFQWTELDVSDLLLLKRRIMLIKPILLLTSSIMDNSAFALHIWFLSYYGSKSGVQQNIKKTCKV